MLRRKTLRLLVIVTVLIGIFYKIGLVRLKLTEAEDPNTIYLAVALPLTGHLAEQGKLMLHAIELYFTQLNQQTVMGEKQVALKIYDTHADPKQTAIISQQIAQDERIVGVLGHFLSSTAKVASKTYAQHKIPAISSSATDSHLTQASPWFFKMTLSETLEAKFLAYTIKHILQHDSANIIYVESDYGTNLKQGFESTAQQIGVHIDQQWSFHQSNFFARSEAIINDLKTKANDTPILLAVDASHGAKLVSLLKEARIKNILVGPSSFLHHQFVTEIELLQSLKANKSIKYTDDIYVISPFLNDAANLKAYQFKERFRQQYQELVEEWDVTHWIIATLAYDAAMLMGKAIKYKLIANDPSDATLTDREKIRSYLAELNSIDSAVEGITGFSYFDDNGNSLRFPYIAMYKDKKVLPALNQFQPVMGTKEQDELKTAINKQWIVPLSEGKFAYKTHIVYTGIKIDEIGNFNPDEGTHTIDFKIWFRFIGDSHPSNIQFTNAVEAVKLTLKEEKKIGRLKYQLYYGEGRFRSDFLKNFLPHQQHLFGLSFHHREHPNTHIIYIPDTVGMNSSGDIALRNKLRQEQVLKLGKEWFIKDAFIFQDIVQPDSLGDPDLIKNAIQGYSRFNLGVIAAETQAGLRYLIPLQKEYFILLIGLFLILFKIHWLIRVIVIAIAFFLVTVLTHGILWQELILMSGMYFIMILSFFKFKALYKRFFTILFAVTLTYPLSFLEIYQSQAFYPFIQYVGIWTTVVGCFLIFMRLTDIITQYRLLFNIIWFLRLLLVFGVLILVEQLVKRTVADWVIAIGLPVQYLNRLDTFFDILWWLTPAFLLDLMIKHFLLNPLEERSSRSIPKIVKGFITLVIYLFASFGIIAFVFKHSITNLLATSGIVTAVIGLAIKDNISNVLSGVMINLERPFRIGDKVKIQVRRFQNDGRIVDINWRTTRLLNRDGHTISIPNSQISEGIVHNFSNTGDLCKSMISLHIDYHHPPERVEKILLDAVLSTEGILDDPGPIVAYRGVSDWAADYIVIFSVNKYKKRKMVRQNLWKRIWIHLNRAGIAPAIQRQEIHAFRGVKSRGEEEATKPITLLKEIDVFQYFTESQKKHLSQQIRCHTFEADQLIVKQGEEGDSLFIVVEGAVSVSVCTSKDEESLVEVARLGAGNFFGEMALFTGEPRAATVVAITGVVIYEIAKADILPLMKENPEFSQKVSEILTNRKISTEEYTDTSGINLQEKQEAVYKRVFSNVCDFFGLEGFEDNLESKPTGINLHK